MNQSYKTSSASSTRILQFDTGAVIGEGAPIEGRGALGEAQGIARAVSPVVSLDGGLAGALDGVASLEPAVSPEMRRAAMRLFESERDRRKTLWKAVLAYGKGSPEWSRTLTAPEADRWRERIEVYGDRVNRLGKAPFIDATVAELAANLARGCAKFSLLPSQQRRRAYLGAAKKRRERRKELEAVLQHHAEGVSWRKIAALTGVPMRTARRSTRARQAQGAAIVSAPESVNGTAAPTIRRLPLPGADADAYHVLDRAGAHFVLCTGDKRPIVKEWQNHPADLPAVLAHAGGTGLIGLVPGSIGAVVCDLDPEGADDTTPPLAGVVVQHATRRKGTHFWYRAPPDGEVRNRKWARTAGGQHVGDVRGSRGFCVLWNPGAVAAAVTGRDFDFADPVDVSTLPWPRKGKGSDVEQMRAAANGARNETLNRLAFARARRGENQATLRAAAIASGLTVAEVSTTIRSAEEGAAHGGPTLAKGGNDERPAKGGADAQETALRMAPELRVSAMYVYGRGWFTRAPGAGLWAYDADGRMVSTVQRHQLFMAARKGTSARNILTELQGWLTVTGDTLDADKWLAGLPDGAGILDLHTGKVRPSTADDRITKTLGVVPDFTAPPEVLPWYLRELTTGCVDPAHRRQRHGHRAPDLARSVRRQAPDLRQRFAAARVMANRHHAGRCVRIATAMTARLMRQDDFTFQSQMHFVCTGNHAPRAPHGAGIWDRLRMVPCTNSHVGNENVTLPPRLRAEAPRILGWVLGAPDKQPDVPEFVELSRNMRDEADPVGAWCKATWRKDNGGCIPARECYEQYETEGSTPSTLGRATVPPEAVV